MIPTSKHPQNFNHQLAGLRGIAVAMVVLLHAGVPGFRGGYLGVDLFFVLSGFLITNTLLRAMDEGGPFMANFYWRRFLRLFPALALVCIALAAFSGGAAPRVRDVIASLTYVSNWTRAFDIGVPVYMGHSWSLAIEEQFYLAWPALLWLLLATAGRKRAAWIAGGLAGLVMAWRGYASSNGYAFSRLYNGFDFRADGLLLGCALSLATFERPAPPSRIGAPVIAAVAVLVALFFKYRESDYAMLTYGLSAANLAIVIIVAYIALPVERPQWVNRVLGSRGMVWLGDISYGLYLWHYPIGFVLLTGTNLGPWPRAFFTVASSLTIASLSYYVIERPLLNSHARTRFTSAAGRTALVYSVGAFVTGSWFFFEGNIRDRLDPHYKVQITAYGPQAIEPGVRFNPQSDGSSALWIQTDGAVTTNAQVRFGNELLPAAVVEKGVTAAVPANLIPSSGSLEMAIVNKAGRTISNIVQIKVLNAPINGPVQ